MTLQTRSKILRLNGLYLMLSAVSGAIMDIRGIFFGAGPEAIVVRQAPYSGIGLLEAHCLAFIVGLILWRAETVRFSHLIGGTAVAVLGTCNLVFWQIFVAVGNLTMGYFFTSLHWLFAILQFAAAFYTSGSTKTQAQTA
jgi:hypothetical protein